MDANVRLPAFFRLDPFVGWRFSSANSTVRIDPATGWIELGFLGTRLSPLTESGGSFGGLSLPTGVAVGPDGSPDRTVLVVNPETGEILRSPHPALFGQGGEEAPGFAPIWPGRSVVPPTTGTSGDEPDHGELERTPQPAGVYELVRPRGLAFSLDGDLLVTDEGDAITPARLLVYAWPSMRVRHVADIGGQPVDIAVDSLGRIYIADAEAGKVRRHSRGWQEDAWPGGTGTLSQPKHLVIDSDDSLFVVDTDTETGINRLSTFDSHGRTDVLDLAAQTAFWQGRYPAPIQESDGQYFAPGEVCVEHGPRLRNVIVDRNGRLPQGPTLIYRPPPGRRIRKGAFITDALDSETFNFAWHRLLLEAELGRAGALEIQSFTSSQYLEPERILNLSESAWSAKIVLGQQSKPEALIQSGPGRYLWLRIGLVGDGVESPRIQGVDILGPRQSSLRFLPAPFHEDATSRDFLDRFLSYFDTVFDEANHGIQQFPAELTPQGAPEGAFLAWLLRWFDIDLLATWSDGTRRDFLANAMNLHRARGTIAGLKAVLRLHLGVAPPMPVLIEGFRLRNYAARRELGNADLPSDGLVRIGGVPLVDENARGLAHRFYVVVPEAVAESDEKQATLRRLVDDFRPAHTAWELITIGPGVRVGCQSTVGVDTLVGAYPTGPLGDMALGQSAYVFPQHQNLTRLGAVRLGTSAAL